MSFKSTIAGGALLLIISSSHAGLFKTTVHSRANCINNESITWWNNHPYNWRVVSIHKYGSLMHSIDTGYKYNDRQAAIHWGEGMANFFEVWGYHYLQGYHDKTPFDSTYATGCEIIDGWV